MTDRMANTRSRPRVRSDWRRRRRPDGLVSIALELLDDAAERQRFLAGMQAHGAIALTLPRSMRVNERAAACYSEAASFFGRRMHEKAPYAISEECQHGCAIYEDGTEFFEVIKHFDRRLWSWPSHSLRAAATGAYECMRAVATRALKALLLALGMDVPHVMALLDTPHETPQKEEESSHDTDTDFNGVSHSALRIWSYAAGALPTAWHCDNTLLTLGVKGTSRGLRIRLLDGRFFYPEAVLGDHQLVLYLGDALSYLTGGRVLSLMHEVVPPLPGAPRRFSMPFFLRARRAASLQPGLASPRLLSARALPPLSVVALEDDEGGTATQTGLRQRWSWKQTPYFTELNTSQLTLADC